MKKWSIALKAAAGYAFFVCILGAAVLLIYRYTRSAVMLSEVEESVAQRWKAANNLVHGIFEVENVERSVCLGHTELWPGYERALDNACGYADSLKSLLSEPRQLARVDSLRLLLGRKRGNTRRLLAVMNADAGTNAYDEKAERLRSGDDSLIVNSNARNVVEEKNVTYVVKETGKNFFSRLADVFRHSRSDTVVTEAYSTSVDSVRHSVNVGDSLADVLAEIGREDKQLRKMRHGKIKERAAILQAEGIELASKTRLLLQDISEAERQWLDEAAGRDVSERKTAVVRMGMLAAFAMLVAFVSLFFIWRDAVRANRYRSELEEARRRAESLLEQRERLLLTIAHDIKSPAASVSGFAELLKDTVRGGKAGEYLSNISSSANHLLHLVGTLLDYHSLEKGRMVARKVMFAPAGLVRDCVAGFAPQATTKSLTLRCGVMPDAGVLCRGDAFRIRQILENLIGNALKYTDEGSVTVAANITGTTFKISVADTGRGMTEEESRRIFDAFTRLPGAQGIEGVGLGLSITRELVTLLGGAIRLETQAGRGSTFFVDIPVGRVEPVEPAAGDAVPEVPVVRDMGEFRILVIDDDTVQLQLTAEMLLRLSGGAWKVTRCRQIEEMLLHLKERKYDLLLTDIEMPGISGFDIVGKIEDKTMPVVAVTAHDAIPDSEFERAGFAARLSKPFTTEQVAEVIRNVMGKAVEVACMAGATDKPGLFAPLTEFAAGDKEAERHILENFREETSAGINAFRKAMAEEDGDGAGNLAHKMLPVMTMIQSPVVPVLRKLSAARKQHALSADELQGCCETVATELERILNMVDEELGSGDVRHS